MHRFYASLLYYYYLIKTLSIPYKKQKVLLRVPFASQTVEVAIAGFAIKKRTEVRFFLCFNND